VRHNLEIGLHLGVTGPHQGKAGLLLGGWQVNGITVVRSGLPVDIVADVYPTESGLRTGGQIILGNLFHQRVSGAMGCN